jgi:diaminohydroxyphosphoribosylaminopyrimidine deaminase / 5-amino-6-(5-phosphoribosylamino)uracil reductase
VDEERDEAYMKRALELALRGRGFTHPNPMVGAVVVRDGVVVGEGWHQEYGGAHAEVAALGAAGDAARGATMYVTLEPCAHHGKTPPCTDALLRAGIRRLVYAAADPHGRAAGGARRLEAAGVELVGDVHRRAARDLNAVFFHIHERAAPFVALKLALSLDGRIAAAPGQRTQLTAGSALTEAHRLRADYEAVLVGARTAAVDDPLLTVRLVPCRRQPVRLVASASADLAPTSRLVRTLDQAPVWLLCAADAPDGRVAALAAAGVEVIRVNRVSDGGVLDLRAALAHLAERGIRSVLAEGGAGIGGSLLDGGLVRRLHLFSAARMLGGDGVRGLEPRHASAWRYTDVRQLGPDLLMTLDPALEPGESR